MSSIVVFPRCQLSSMDKGRLTKQGVIYVEADDPSKVVVLVPSPSLITGDDLMMSALAAVTCGVASAGVSQDFAVSLNKRLKAREAERLATKEA